MNANLYPLFLNLKGRTCVVVGGGEVAALKVHELLDAGARIRLIAPEVTNQISTWARERKLRWEPRIYQADDLREAFLVVSAADSETNARVFAEAETQHIFCNAVDDTPHCSCYASAVVRRGSLQIAISTTGNSPALAQRLRKEFQEQFGQEYGPWVEQLGEARALLLQDKDIPVEARRDLLHKQASAEAFENFRKSLPREDNHSSVIIPESSRTSS